MTDFRSKFNKNIVTKVREFKEKRTRERQETSALLTTEINEFISQEVAEQILSRYLNGTDIEKLKRCGTMDQLVLLVRKAFKIHYTAYDINAIKELDNITMDCKVPSKSGKNIASKLPLANNWF